jgi:hypothetical protein
MNLLKLKELQNKSISNRFALLPVLCDPAITHATIKLLPTLPRLGDVEAPQSTRGRMPAQHPAAFLCEHEFARMKILARAKTETTAETETCLWFE